MLEAALHQESSFVTLTYSDENLPEHGHLSKEHAQNWQKRLRALFPPKALRFLTVGEYGDESQRPHYHAAVFGTSDPERLCQSWDLGFVDVRGIGPESAAYIASYALKRHNTEERCGGKPREFKIQSNRPGIGMEAIKRLRLPAGETPTAIRLQGRLYPLGRYLANGIRSRQGETLEDVAFRHRLTKYTLLQRDPKTLQDKIENAKRTTQSIKNRRQEKPGV